MDSRPGNPLPSPKGPRFKIVDSWPIYGPRDEVHAVPQRHRVAPLFLVPDLVPSPPHQDSCLCAACQELPF